MGKVSLKDDQHGVVSIVVTVVFILIMSLIVLSMAQNANREQRQALDRQLSDQAFYNAETGINDWAKFLYENPNAKQSKTQCIEGGFPAGAPTSGTIDGDINSYSCVTYDKAPVTLEVKPLGTNEAKMIKLKPQSAAQAVKIKWRAFDAANQVTGCNFAGNNNPGQLGANCNVGGIRLDLFRQQPNRDAMIANNFTAYLLPANGGAVPTVNYSSALGLANQGVRQIVRCTNAEGCEAIINMAGNPINSGEPYYLNIKALYVRNTLTVEGYSSVADALANRNRLRLAEAQIMIDSTGKANDVLRRIQVRVPYDPSTVFAGTGAGDTLTTRESICKLVNVSVVRGTATSDPSCL